MDIYVLIYKLNNNSYVPQKIFDTDLQAFVKSLFVLRLILQETEKLAVVQVVREIYSW